MYPKSTECSILKYLKIHPAGRATYQRLAAFHYRDGKLGPYSHIFALMEEHCRRRIVLPVAGVIVYRPPVANLAIRNQVTGGYFTGLDRSAGLTLLNEHVRCISRVIIDPHYRGLGLAARLVRETMPLTGASLVEASSVMSCVNPFFERAGMQAFDPPPDMRTEQMATALETVGIEQRCWIDPMAVQQRIERLESDPRAFLDEQIGRFLQKFPRQRHWPDSLKRTDFVLSKLGHPGRYHLWQNPDKPIPGLTIG